MKRGTGLLPDRESSRLRDEREFGLSITGTGPPIQPIVWIRDQHQFPSCVGQALAACIDAARSAPPWASAVSIWREARRRQGRIERIDSGTRFEYGLDGLVWRGWDPWREGEDTDPIEAGLGAPDAGDDLADELFAFDKRGTARRYRVTGYGADRLDGVESALRAGLGVVFGTGVRAPFFEYRSTSVLTDAILGTEFLGGPSNIGHGMRIAGAGARDGARIFLVQNSWSKSWGGCHLPDSSWAPGCCWVNEAVIVGAWDIHAVEPHT